MRVSDIVQPDMNIARSTSLERDKSATSFIRDYQLTAKATEALGRFADALGGEKVSAWSLTGPYGMGKSSFVSYLMALTGPKDDPLTEMAMKKLEDSSPQLHSRISNAMAEAVDDAGFFRIAVTAAYEPINNTLAQGLREALMSTQLDSGDQCIERLNRLINSDCVDPRELLAVFEDVRNLAGCPMIVVVDEFGKCLDYMSHHPGEGDIFIVQQLAELDDIYLWVCLHQAFDDYALGLSILQRQEWAKVQGRFEDISFVESTPQMLYLIGRTLKQSQDEEMERLIRRWAVNAHELIDQLVGADKQYFDVDAIAGMYPLHPLTAIALIELCKKYAQNDRTLFAFMCGGHKNALPAYIQTTVIASEEWLPSVGLDYLYDYFFNIVTTTYVNRSESQRWIEIHDIIRGASHLSVDEYALLKTIGVLNLLSNNLGIKANLANICAIMEYSHNIPRAKVCDIVEEFANKGFLIYREYADEYRLWEGSDFDIHGAVRQKRERLISAPLDAILQRYVELSPVTASRHSYKTGTTRRFERRWVDVASLSDGLSPCEGFDGLLVYSFGTTPEPSFIPRICNDGRPLLVAYSGARRTIHELALELAASRLVLENSPELMHDSVARKEMRFRIEVAEQKLRIHLKELYSPGSERVKWYKSDRITGVSEVHICNARGLSSILSDLCDEYYYKSPRIHNEMVSYHTLSGAASRARRELVEAMATRSAEERLGFDGFPQEVALYISLLEAEGLHRRDDATGFWYLTLEGRDNDLNYVWEQIDQCIENADDSGISVADILKVLYEPPFGMRQGPAPIYLSLYILVKSEEIAVFLEDKYLPYVSAADMALMLKRPELFVLKKFAASNMEREVFDLYRAILNTIEIAADTGLRNATMLGVVGPLTRFIDELTAYAKRTRNISTEAQRVRTAILNSVDPIELLFEGLPNAVGVELGATDGWNREWQDAFQNRLRSSLLELGEAYNLLTSSVKDVVAEAFRCEDLAEFRATQCEDLKKLIDICNDNELKAVLRALTRKCDSIDDWVDGIAGTVSRKPMSSWRDGDLELFALKLRDFASRIEQLQQLAAVTGYSRMDNAICLNILMPDGNVIRKSVIPDDEGNAVVRKTIDEVMKLSEAANLSGDERWLVISGLVESLLEGDKDAT